MTSFRHLGTTFAAAWLCALGCPAAYADTQLVDRAPGVNGAKANAEAGDVALSGDGRYVVFVSRASNLDPAVTTTAYSRVYRRDVQTGETVLVSRADGKAGEPVPGSSADISSDGRYVAFTGGLITGSSSGVIAGCPNGSCLVVRDIVAGTTTVAGRADGLTGAPLRDAFHASISDDGRYVAFETPTALDPADLNGTSGNSMDVYVRDLVAGSTVLASRANGPGGTTGGSGEASFVPSLSSNGRRVAFESVGDFSGSAPGSPRLVYVRDLDANTTVLASRADGAGGAPLIAADDPSLSADGKHVSFAGQATFGDTRVYVRDLTSSHTEPMPSPPDLCFIPQDEAPVSGDGRYLAFSAFVKYDDGGVMTCSRRQVFQVDRLAGGGLVRLASRASGVTGAPGNGDSGRRSNPGRTDEGLAISDDGRFVAFESGSSNLDPDDGDSLSDVFRRQLRPAVAASLPAVVSTSTTWATGGAGGSCCAATFTYGTRPLVPLMGDWDANGSRTAGTYGAGVFKLRNSNSAGDPDITFTFGDPRGFPVAGDFDGDSSDDVAVYRNGTWQVRLSTGTVLASFSFGTGSWPATVPIAGDWDGNLTDGIGTYTYNTATWNLRHTASAGAADIGPFEFGTPNASYPVPGDWNTDAIDTVGAKQGATWSLRNTNSGGAADLTFPFGLANDLPLTWRP